MNTYEEKTLPLWDDGRKKNVALRNIRTGKKYSFELEHSFVVGSNQEYCDLQITAEDRYMSRRHLRFICDSGTVFVEDLQSKNGSRLNGRLISSRMRVRTGDTLKMGRSEFEITVGM